MPSPHACGGLRSLGHRLQSLGAQQVQLEEARLVVQSLCQGRIRVLKDGSVRLAVVRQQVVLVPTRQVQQGVQVLQRVASRRVQLVQLAALVGG